MGEVFFPEAEMRNVFVEDIRGGFLSFMGSVSVDSSEFKYINANISFESYGGAIHNFRVIYENETVILIIFFFVKFHGMLNNHCKGFYEPSNVHKNYCNLQRV